MIRKKEGYTVSFITLGCKVNQFETEAMTEILEGQGFRVLNENEISDIYIINTCAVTRESERKSRQFINRAKRINPAALVVAVGCSVQLNAEKINRETQADIIIGTKNKADIARLIRDKLNNINNGYEIDDFQGRESFEELKISSLHDKTRANIKIQDGCSQFCSYCIIPYVRGPIRSRNYHDIIREIEKIAEKGYKEVVLNGIHISSYGKDFKEDDALIKLIEAIDEIDGIQRIRLGSLEPNLIDQSFMERYAGLSKTCDHFHLSLQSGSDSVLKRMNRRYTSLEFKNNVDLIRKYMPWAGITTDIIVGFPGESDEEFKETLDFVKDIKFSRIHVFKYSKREGTKAAKMADQVDPSIKASRSKALIDLAHSISNDFMKKFINKDVSVLIEKEKKENIYEGYTTNYLKVLAKSDINIVNEVINLTIDKISNDYLLSE